MNLQRRETEAVQDYGTSLRQIGPFCTGKALLFLRHRTYARRRTLKAKAAERNFKPQIFSLYTVQIAPCRHINEGLQAFQETGPPSKALSILSLDRQGRCKVNVIASLKPCRSYFGREKRLCCKLLVLTWTPCPRAWNQYSTPDVKLTSPVTTRHGGRHGAF